MIIWKNTETKMIFKDQKNKIKKSYSRRLFKCNFID